MTRRPLRYSEMDTMSQATKLTMMTMDTFGFSAEQMNSSTSPGKKLEILVTAEIRSSHILFVQICSCVYYTE